MWFVRWGMPVVKQRMSVALAASALTIGCAAMAQPSIDPARVYSVRVVIEPARRLEVWLIDPQGHRIYCGDHGHGLSAGPTVAGADLLDKAMAFRGRKAGPSHAPWFVEMRSSETGPATIVTGFKKYPYRFKPHLIDLKAAQLTRWRLTFWPESVSVLPDTTASGNKSNPRP